MDVVVVVVVVMLQLLWFEWYVWVTCCTSKKTVALKVSETGHSCMHLDGDAESEEPFCTEPATDRHELSSLKDVENWSSCQQDEAACTKSRSFNGSHLQERNITSDIAACDESDQNDVFEAYCADAKPAVAIAQELRASCTEHEDTQSSAAVAESASENELCVIESVHTDTENCSSDSSCLQEIVAVIDVAVCDESDQHNVFDVDSAEAPALTASELCDAHIEREEMESSAAVVESTSENKLCAIESVDTDTKCRSSEGSRLQEIVVAGDVMMYDEPSQHSVFDTDSAESRMPLFMAQDLSNPYKKHEKTLNFAEAVESTSLSIESHAVESVEILELAERTASTTDNCNGQDLVACTSDIDSTSDMLGSFDAVYSPVIDSQACADAGMDNSSYHKEDEICVVDDVNSSYVVASQHLIADNQHDQDVVQMDVTEEVEVRCLTADQSVYILASSQAVSSNLPCVPLTVSESELHSADESSSSFPSHGGCEEEMKVCYVRCMCGTLHGTCMYCHF